jgi:Phage terminase, small subunit
MAISGRKPTPIALKLVRNNPSKRPLRPPAGGQPRQGAIPVPDVVRAIPRAKALWTAFLRDAPPGHLAPLDAPLLGRLCVALAWAEEASEKVAETGLLVRLPVAELPTQSPYLAIANRQTELARKLMAELGLTTSERSRIGPPVADLKASPWDALDS